MSDQLGQIFAEFLKAIRAVDDPAELQTQLRAMVDKEFPVVKPVFTVGETIPMHEFLARFEREICAGVVPSFYDRKVTVVDTGAESVMVAIRCAEQK